MSSVLDVLGLRVFVVMMRLCIRHSRCSNSRNNKDREDFLQNIVHGANLMGENLMTVDSSAFKNAGTVYRSDSSTRKG
ncbi:hypothetical protein [Caballeronia sp. dw_19]|uniref:hypothetical protein n=1 Tax=Caballeronia sp. dw_19 TaxID=2719791 RepID=UPI001BD37672|nr:hypothetical protein [Caballeronia sp. dw_19]